MRHEWLRKLRKEKGLTLAQLGKQTGYTPSFLSQLERGLKRPSLDAMRKIADTLGVSLISLLGEEPGRPAGSVRRNTQCSIIRGQERRQFTLEEKRTVYEMLTPQTDGDSRRYAMHGILVTVEPGVWTNEKPISHFHEECCYILSGRMRAVVGDEIYDLEPGDSLYIDGYALHNFFNPGDAPLIVLAFQAI